MAREFAPATSRLDARPGGGGRDVDAGFFAESLRVNRAQMLAQRLDAVRPGQGDDAPAEAAAGHPGAVDAGDLHALLDEVVQLGTLTS